MSIPCGQCVGCRLERSRQWAIRCVHEASLHQHNCFVTLTYNDANLPPGQSLNYRHFQLFMKRLRKRLGDDIRFYMCGEYGENFGRPHYHAILFNVDFPDKTVWRKTKTGHHQYRSKILEELWPFGNSEIGSVTFDSAAYCARYIMKKVTGEASSFHYCTIDPLTGEVLSERTPEFNNMSRRPGLAKGWFDAFHATDVAPHDHVVIRGRTMKPPKYYDYCYELLSPDEMKKVKARRASAARKALDNSTPERLAAREAVVQANLSRLSRPLT